MKTSCCEIALCVLLSLLTHASRESVQAAGFFAAATSSGGTILFNNLVPGSLDVRVILPDGTPAGAGWTAQLYGGPEGGTLAPLTPTTTFRTSPPAAMGYLNGIDVTVPTVAPQGRASFLVRVFNGASFETSSVRLESNPFTATLGGGLLPPTSLVGLQSFHVVPAGSPPAITVQPQGGTLIVGSTVTLTVVATGSAPLSYQWRKNQAPIAGATDATLTLKNAQPNAAGVYDVVVSNSFGSVESVETILSLPVDPNAGAVSFNNLVPGTVDVRVILPDGSPAGAGWTAQLYGGPAGGTLAPLFPTTTFRTSPAAALGYINAIDVSVPTVAPQNRATFVVRVYNGDTFETSSVRLESNPFTVTLGGGLLPPALLAGLQRISEVKPEPPKPFVVRQLPIGYSAGVKLTVILKAAPADTVAVYAVEDIPPAGWSVSNISNGGSFDTINRAVKWGPFFDHTARNLSYDVTPPAGETGVKQFNGFSSADGVNIDMGGASSLDLLKLTHPADSNPADFRISISEVTAYGLAWLKGTTWPTPPNPIPIDYVTRAGTLWKNGESYVVDSSVPAPPLWWVNAARAAGLQRFGLAANPSAGSSAQCSVSPLFVPGEALTVGISVKPAAGVSAYAVQDQVPAGWKVTQVSDAGAFDQQNGQVKWGPFFDNEARQLSYSVLAPADSTEPVVFQGAASFDGASTDVVGQRQSRPTVRLSALSFVPSSPTAAPHFEFTLTGRPSGSCVIETSSNLFDWVPVYTNVVRNETVVLPFLSAPPVQGQYYRAVTR